MYFQVCDSSLSLNKIIFFLIKSKNKIKSQFEQNRISVAWAGSAWIVCVSKNVLLLPEFCEVLFWKTNVVGTRFEKKFMCSCKVLFLVLWISFVKCYVSTIILKNKRSWNTFWKKSSCVRVKCYFWYCEFRNNRVFLSNQKNVPVPVQLCCVFLCCVN